MTNGSKRPGGQSAWLGGVLVTACLASIWSQSSLGQQRQQQQRRPAQPARAAPAPQPAAPLPPFRTIDTVAPPVEPKPLPRDFAEFVKLYERTVGQSFPEIPRTATGELARGRLPPGVETAVERIAAGRADLAVDWLMRLRAFHRGRIVTFISRMSNEDQRPFETIDDYQGHWSTAFHEDLDVRDLLFRGMELSTSSDSYSYNYGSTFAALEFDAAGFRTTFRDLPRTFSTDNTSGRISPVGLLTSTGFARRFLDGGTNRRPVRAAMDLFLCSKIENWQNASLMDAFVGRDVDRFPGRDPASGENSYMTTCRACHAPMDALRGAWARANYQNQGGRRTFTSGSVDRKYNQNGDVYPDGYVTYDSAWENLLTSPQDRAFYGWAPGTERGDSLESFGRMIASSRRFRECMAIRAFENLCPFTDAEEMDRRRDPELLRVAADFASSDFKLRRLFKQTILSPACTPSQSRHAIKIKNGRQLFQDLLANLGLRDDDLRGAGGPSWDTIRYVTRSESEPTATYRAALNGLPERGDLSELTPSLGASYRVAAATCDVYARGAAARAYYGEGGRGFILRSEEASNPQAPRYSRAQIERVANIASHSAFSRLLQRAPSKDEMELVSESLDEASPMGEVVYQAYLFACMGAATTLDYLSIPY